MLTVRISLFQMTVHVQNFPLSGMRLTCAFKIHFYIAYIGMWGAKTHLNRELMANLTRQMLFRTKMKRRKQYDQDILRVVLWPAIKHTMVRLISKFHGSVRPHV